MLTTNQLQAIDHHLRKENWLLNEELITELTDHYVAGIENRLTQGIEFDTALKAIHADFGGRKGLITMEEGFQISQTKLVMDLTKQQVFSFFRLPKLPITLLIMVSVYSLIRLNPTVDTSWFYNNLWVLIVAAVGQVCVVWFGLFQLVKYNQRGAFSKKLGATVTRLGLFWYISHLIALDEWITVYPLAASSLITLFLVYEIAAVQLLIAPIREHGKPKIA
jgi:hypothetical protein